VVGKYSTSDIHEPLNIIIEEENINEHGEVERKRKRSSESSEEEEDDFPHIWRQPSRTERKTNFFEIF